MRAYWRNPGFWRWWWQNRAPRDVKLAAGWLIAVALLMAGYFSADLLAAGPEAPATFPPLQVVTVVRTTRVNVSPEVVAKSQTVTEPGETHRVTVRRNGRTVVLRAPGETITPRSGVEPRVVTSTRTDTIVRTETVNRLTTVRAPGTTETVTREVVPPAHTVTQTTTQQVTVTHEVTVTETVTETCRKRCDDNIGS
jgi:hypothetical protein